MERDCYFGGYLRAAPVEPWDTLVGLDHGVLDLVESVTHAHPLDGSVDGFPVEHTHPPGGFEHSAWSVSVPATLKTNSRNAAKAKAKRREVSDLIKLFRSKHRRAMGRGDVASALLATTWLVDALERYKDLA